MERKTKFIPKEYYHIFSRGVEKRRIFLSEKDYRRFLILLYIHNQPQSFRFGNFLAVTGNKIMDIYNKERERTLVSVLGYSLMPNHFHICLQEKEEGGISKFMMKVLTAYSMYFNQKNERSGPLFVHPFRSVHIGEDAQFRHIFSYIHLNALEIREPNWKQEGVKDKKESEHFLENYSYSSYPDFLGSNRVEGKILDLPALPDFISRATLDMKDYEGWYRKDIV